MKKVHYIFLIVAIPLTLYLLNLNKFEDTIPIEHKQLIDKAMEEENRYTQNISYSKSYEIIDNTRNVIYQFDNNEMKILDFDLNVIDRVGYNTKLGSINKILSADNYKYLYVYGVDSQGDVILMCIDSSTLSQNYIDFEDMQLYSFDLSSNVNQEKLYLHVYSELEDKVYYGYVDNCKLNIIREIDFESIYDYYVGDNILLKIREIDGKYNISSAKSGKLILSIDVSSYFKTDMDNFNKRGIENPFVTGETEESIYLLNPLTEGFGSLYRYDIDSDEIQLIEERMDFKIDKIIAKDKNNIIILGTDGSSKHKIVGNFSNTLGELIRNNKNVFPFSYSSDFKQIFYYESDFKDKYLIRKVYVNAETNIEETLGVIENEDYILKSDIFFENDRYSKTHGYIYNTKRTPGEKRPLVIQLHGGPSGRYSYEYYDVSQIFCRLGFEVIELNYHGSTEFGFKYYDEAGDNIPEVATKDLKDVIDWAKTQPYIDSNKIVIFGMSYGGYLSLLASLELEDDILVSVASIPGDIKFMEQSEENERYIGAIAKPEIYDIWERLKTSKKEVGIQYDPFDPNLRIKIDWRVLSSLNSKVKIIDETHDGHTVTPESFKKILGYILDRCEIDN